MVQLLASSGEGHDTARPVQFASAASALNLLWPSSPFSEVKHSDDNAGRNVLRRLHRDRPKSESGMHRSGGAWDMWAANSYGLWWMLISGSQPLCFRQSFYSASMVGQQLEVYVDIQYSPGTATADLLTGMIVSLGLFCLGVRSRQIRL